MLQNFLTYNQDFKNWNESVDLIVNQLVVWFNHVEKKKKSKNNQ